MAGPDDNAALLREMARASDEYDVELLAKARKLGLPLIRSVGPAP